MNSNQPSRSSERVLDRELSKIINATHHDPFSVLGKHNIDGTEIVRVFMPRATEVQLPDISANFQRIPDTDLFEWKGEPG
ncbi:GlgB N-terminal domain-containing protein, partial [Kaarinaea lacus]